MTHKTIDGLREMLETRAAEVVTPPALAARTTQLAHGVRTRRRMITGGVTVLALTAAVVPVVIGWPESGVRPEPADTATVNPDDGGAVWSPDLPGLDLPEGDPLTGAYMVDNMLMFNGTEVPVEDPGGMFTTVPDGVVVTSGHPSGPTSSQTASLLLVGADGDMETIDSGVIAGFAAARQSDGSVLLAYGWLESPTAATGEIRVVEIGSDDPPQVIPVDQAATVLGLSGRSVRIAYSSTDSGGDQAWVDLATGEADPLGESVTSIGATAGGLEVTWDDSAQCLRGSSSDGAEVWQRCDLLFNYGLSPDGRWIMTESGTVDAESGQNATAFDLPPDARALAIDPPEFRVRLVGWEDADHPVYTVGAVEVRELGEGLSEGSVTTYVAVRCSISTAECERIPHPTGLLGEVVE